MIDIEFICTGNNGRSPLAEAVANRVAMTLGLSDLRISSSGTMVDPVGDLKAMLLPYVKKAISKGIFRPELEGCLGVDPVSVLYKMRAHEAGIRDSYLWDSIGLEDFLHNPRQTVVRPQAQLILPIDKSNFDRVVRIYSDSEYRPKILTLGEYSGLGYNLVQDFPSTEQEFRSIAAQIEAATRVAILKAIM